MLDQGVTSRTPGMSGRASTSPKACRTPTFPASITTMVELSRKKAPMAVSRTPAALIILAAGRGAGPR
jgi:hypothetical protein